MSSVDFQKILTGAGLAVAGALLAWAADSASSGALGPWALALAPLFSTGLNAFRKWVEARNRTDPPSPDGWGA